MKLKPPTILWATGVTFLLLFLADANSFAWFGGQLSGNISARLDGLRGHFEIRICDVGDCTGAIYTDNSEEKEYRRLLKEKHDITYNIVCGSARQPKTAFWQSFYEGNASGYTDVSQLTINRKFGKAFLFQVHREAIQNILSSTTLTQEVRDNLETALRVDEMDMAEAQKEDQPQ
jgi:hypothetical protein